VIYTEMPEVTEEEMVKPLAEEDGWQIARASFTREAMHYSIRGGIALAILGALAFGAFYIFDQLVKMPPEAVSGVQKILSPVQKYLPFGGMTGGAGGTSVENSELAADKALKSGSKSISASTGSAKLKTAVRHGRKRNRQIASRPGHGHVRPVQAGDDPTGGRVIYRDGMITEYSWK